MARATERSDTRFTGAERVTIVNVDIPFDRLISLLVKVSVAAIPAAIILGLIGLVVAIIFAGVVGGFNAAG